METYISSSKKQFEFYKSLGEKTFRQLTSDQLFYAPASESNSIAIIVQHLHGNMLSRWSDFLNSDGEKPWRKRDEEFEVVINDKREMMRRWEEGWTCLFVTLNNLNNGDLNKTVYIRNQGHSVVDAVNRQLCHYAYHVGQIVYIGKLLQDKEWNTLSIARNRSAEYNAEKFSRERSMQHFTDEFLRKDDKSKSDK